MGAGIMSGTSRTSPRPIARGSMSYCWLELALVAMHTRICEVCWCWRSGKTGQRPKYVGAGEVGRLVRGLSMLVLEKWEDWSEA